MVRRVSANVAMSVRANMAHEGTGGTNPKVSCSLQSASERNILHLETRIHGVRITGTDHNVFKRYLRALPAAVPLRNPGDIHPIPALQALKALQEAVNS